MRIPRCKPLVVAMPKEHNYRIDEGRYRATIHKILRIARSNGENSGDVLRMVFSLSVPGKEQLLNLAKTEFNLNLEHGSELRKALVILLGKEAVSAMSGNQINFESLVGLPVDVEIEHIRTNKSDQYDYPYVNVCDVQQPGTLLPAKPTLNPEPKETLK